MKRTLITSLLASALLFGGGCSDDFDDSALWKGVDEIYNQLTELEKQADELNGQVRLLASVVNGGVITSITQDAEGNDVIRFKGADNIEHSVTVATKDDVSSAPILGTKEENGVLYWTTTVDGNTDFLKDTDGSKIPVAGRTPEMAVDKEGYWTLNGRRLTDASGNPVKAEGKQTSLITGISRDDNGNAIFTLGDGSTVSAPIFDAFNIVFKIGDTAYALGYPGNSSQRQDFATYDIDDITITRGIISKRTTTSFSTYEAFQMDVSIAPGNSGGPLVDEKGNVIGINVAGAIDPNTGLSLGMNYAIIINELTKILDVERIPYTFSGSGFSLFHGPGSAVLLLLGILLIAAGTFFFWKEREAAASVTNSRSGLADRSSSFGGGLANGAASGLNGNPVPSGAAGGSSAHAILRGMIGSYAGQSFDLLKGKIIIGRDPAFCNIVYEKSTPGISSRHCQLSYNPGEGCFVLTDLGSSYGTFLGNGKKLTPNVPEKLYAGDTFFLCDPANRFLVAKE